MDFHGFSIYCKLLQFTPLFFLFFHENQVQHFVRNMSFTPKKMGSLVPIVGSSSIMVDNTWQYNGINMFSWVEIFFLSLYNIYISILLHTIYAASDKFINQLVQRYSGSLMKPLVDAGDRLIIKSKEVTLLQFSSEYDFSVSTQPQSIRGESWRK